MDNINIISLLSTLFNALASAVKPVIDFLTYRIIVPQGFITDFLGNILESLGLEHLKNLLINGFTPLDIIGISLPIILLIVIIKKIVPLL